MTLCAEDELELARRAHAGDRAARAELLEANLAIVGHVVPRWRRHDVAEDLEAAGRFALWRAVLGFDPAHGVRFSSFAFPIVARAVGLEVARLASVASGWVRHLGRDSRALEAGELGAEAAEGARVRLALRRGDRSLDTPINGAEDGATWLEALTTAHPDAEAEATAEDRLDVERLRARVRQAVDAAPLDARERAIVGARVLAEDGAEETLAELGGRLRLSRERIRQIEGVAHERLERALERAGLGPELRGAA